MVKHPVTVVVMAPAGSGKTRCAKTLAKRFGCTSIVDEWDGASPLPPGCLALTNMRPDAFGVDDCDALQQAG